MIRKLFITVMLLFTLASCTFPVTVTLPETPGTGPTEPLEETPVNSGGAPVVVPPMEETPVFNDPADLVIETKFDLIASPNGTGNCLTIQTACSLPDALAKLSTGQRLVLRGGVYKAGSKVDLAPVEGTVTSITAFPNEVPIIDGSTNPQVPGLTLVGDNFLVADLQFRYNWTGLLVQGNSNDLVRLKAYANRVEGISVSGIRNVIRNVAADSNSIGIKIEGAIPIVRYNTVTNNQQGLLISATNSTVEYILAYDNVQGVTMGRGTLRYSVGMYNETSFLTVAESVINNNTVIGGQQSFLSSTSVGQPASIFVYNLVYDVPAPQLTADTSQSNSWELNITDPQFISIDPSSPLFARISFDSPALKVPALQGIPISNPPRRVGAYGSP